MGITIKQLSEMSGYSCSTISRVITNKGNVKAETREAVERLLMEQNYRTNVMELRMAGINQRTIMIIVGDLDNWFYMEMIRGIQRRVAEEGYISVIGYSDNEEKAENEYVQMAYQESYAGIMFINVKGDSILKQMLMQNKCPVVFLNRSVRFVDLDTVCSDNYQGGYMATNYLIEMGHRKIAHLTGSLYSSVTFERMRGYEDAMRDAHCVISKHSLFYGDLKRESGYQFGRQLAEKGWDFTAVFCGNDLMAVGLLEALEEYGIQVPEEVSIVCYDDTPIAEKAKIHLTTVGVEASRMGKVASEMLLSRIAGENIESRTISFKPKMTIRDSVRKI
ncbi:LacI family transcriptional regulator [Clostridium sp. AF19-22AC]|uniref:LacI family transcriptional regulator n=1 Tax=Faecalicatena orotica TaxID=1544 RepID=A0A2Y9CAG4_9FIRM|nr:MULTISPECIES: LacI family DNA-binding transcriptional regulator [Clostridia]PWJ23804.1 LacI family transcriptional regulator [Faecalicatena orotica]RHR29799.1 LacI family transcriptional regulator [Clostridium sp. AF19-22AC]SSA57363.1 LacI family transcriptional regulator [Faecalicatena orotica]